MAIMLLINLIVLVALMFKYGWSKVMDLSELKRFYFWAILMLFVGNLLTVIKINSFNVEFLYEQSVLYLSFFTFLKVYELSNSSIKKIILRVAFTVSIILIGVQVFMSMTGDFWNWDGISLGQEIISVTPFLRFFNLLWIIFTTTIGIFIMQLMSEIDRDNEYVDALVMVLLYLVIIVGTYSLGFFPRIWMWTFTGIYLGMAGRFLDVWIRDLEIRRPQNINILGLRVDNVDTHSAIQLIDKMAQKKNSSLVITPYSEFFVKIQKNKGYKRALDTATLSLADGVYVNWASLYQRMPVSSNIFIRVFQSIWLYVFSGASIVLFPRLLKTVIKARVSGSDIIYPVCELAAKKKYKVMLYGGFDFGRGNTGILAANKLKKMYKGLNIVNVYTGLNNPKDDAEAERLINKYQPDILFMCLGTREPEWLYKRKSKVKFGVAFAMGGTFDYVAGDAVKVNKEVTEKGLEWLARPVMLIGTGGLKASWKRFTRVWTGMLVGSLLVLVWKIKFGYIEEEKK